MTVIQILKIIFLPAVIFYNMLGLITITLIKNHQLVNFTAKNHLTIHIFQYNKCSTTVRICTHQ